MLAEPIVNGFKEEMTGRVDVVHLSMLSVVGHEVGGRYGVQVVPTSLLFDNEGKLIKRVDGLPNKDDLIAQIQGREERKLETH
ncbi:MAG: TlpA family protein disulfide reductase [Candidatus Promineifilaceae bacterium]|jgi:thioredoxin-related protein